jgi:hypothetical protein
MNLRLERPLAARQSQDDGNAIFQNDRAKNSGTSTN